MITTQDLLALKTRYEDELRMAQAKIAVVSELLDFDYAHEVQSVTVETVSADEQGEIVDENLVDESYYGGTRYD